MPMTLEEALRDVELEEGRTYYVHLRNRVVQVRLLKESAGAKSPVAIEEGMLEPWVALPDPAGPTTVHRAAVGHPDLPSRPDIPTEDES